MNVVTENAEGLRCGSPRSEHVDGYKGKTGGEKSLFEVEWLNVSGQSKVIEVIDGNKRALIG